MPSYVHTSTHITTEHTAIVIMASTASTVAVAMEIIAALDLFYDVRLNGAVAIFQIFASQMIGYGIAGVLRELLVYPTYAFYPTYISVVNLLQSLHFGDALNHKRRKFFWIVFCMIFCWEWYASLCPIARISHVTHSLGRIPQYPFPLLTAISIICLVDNGRHDFVRNLFGAGSSNEGIGLFSFGTSWTLITQGSPLVWPLQTRTSHTCWIFDALLTLSLNFHSCRGQLVPWHGTRLSRPHALLLQEHLRRAPTRVHVDVTILRERYDLRPVVDPQRGQLAQQDKARRGRPSVLHDDVLDLSDVL